jgi:hypothetical protein
MMAPVLRAVGLSASISAFGRETDPLGRPPRRRGAESAPARVAAGGCPSGGDAVLAGAADVAALVVLSR